MYQPSKGSYTYRVGDVYILWHLQYISYREVSSTLWKEIQYSYTAIF